MQTSYKFELGYTFIRYSVRDLLGLSNNEYVVAHALGFVGASDKSQTSIGPRTNYRPGYEQLATDIGLSEKTVRRCVKTLQNKGLVNKETLEATEQWSIAEQAKNEKISKYAYIEHGTRLEMNLTITQYIIVWLYARLNEGREWVTIDKKEIKYATGLSHAGLWKATQDLEQKAFLRTKIRKMSNGRHFLDVQVTENWSKYEVVK